MKRAPQVLDVCLVRVRTATVGRAPCSCAAPWVKPERATSGLWVLIGDASKSLVLRILKGTHRARLKGCTSTASLREADSTSTRLNIAGYGGEKLCRVPLFRFLCCYFSFKPHKGGFWYLRFFFLQENSEGREGR